MVAFQTLGVVVIGPWRFGVTCLEFISEKFGVFVLSLFESC